MRLIDGDRLLSERMKSKYYHLPNGDVAIPIIDIEHAPTIEPEIIHCRECKHWKSKEHIGNNNVSTLNIASLPCKNWLTAPDWYCGSAERREE